MARYTAYKPEYCETIIELGKAGKSVTQMACALGVVKQTVYNWADEFPEFMDALTHAKQWSQNWWEDQGQMGLTADRFQPSLWAKQVSCRFPDDYRDKTQLDQQFLDKQGRPTDPSVSVRFVE